jgi:hypothetical protein
MPDKSNMGSVTFGPNLTEQKLFILEVENKKLKDENGKLAKAWMEKNILLDDLSKIVASMIDALKTRDD